MLFRQLTEILAVHEQINFIIKKVDDNMLDVIVMPKLEGDNNGKLTDELAKIRSALSMPLRVKATVDELDSAFLDKLTGYVTAQVELNDVCSMLKQAQETATKALVKAENKKIKTKPIYSAAKNNTEENDDAGDSDLDEVDSETTTSTVTTQLF